MYLHARLASPYQNPEKSSLIIHRKDQPNLPTLAELKSTAISFLLCSYNFKGNKNFHINSFLLDSFTDFICSEAKIQML